MRDVVPSAFPVPDTLGVLQRYTSLRVGRGFSAYGGGQATLVLPLSENGKGLDHITHEQGVW